MGLAAEDDSRDASKVIETVKLQVDPPAEDTGLGSESDDLIPVDLGFDVRRNHRRRQQPRD